MEGGEEKGGCGRVALLVARACARVGGEVGEEGDGERGVGGGGGGDEREEEVVEQVEGGGGQEQAGGGETLATAVQQPGGCRCRGG